MATNLFQIKSQITYLCSILEEYLPKEEIELVKTIMHSNIVNIHEIYEEERCFALVMDLMEGGELIDVIIENR